MSKKLSRRQFLQIAGMTSLAGALAACAKTAEPTPVATDAPETVEVPKPTPIPETVTLDYYWVANSDTEQRPLVEAAINDYIEPLIGANVVFHLVGWGDWETKALTALQAGEKIDIFFTADWYYYMQLVTEGLFLPLNDSAGPNGNLLDQYGQGILAGLNPAFITGTQIDGVNYAIPTNKELTVPEGFMYNLTWAEEIGLTPEEAANIKNYRDMEPWLEKAKAAHPEEYPYLTDGRDGFSPWVPDFASGVPMNLVNMKYAPDANGVWDETIVSVMETDWAKEHLGIMREWYEKEWIHPDVGLGTFEPRPIFNAGKFLFNPQPLICCNLYGLELMNASGNDDLRIFEFYGQPYVNVTTHAGGSMLAIPTFSEYPVQAMKYINLMHTDSKLVNMMLFGVEGTHWEFEADGRVNIIDSAWYGAHPGPWTIGSQMIQAVSNKEDPEKNRLLVESSMNSLDHPSLGFRFRTVPVAAELTAVVSIAEGTDVALFTGYVDPEEVLPTYISDLKAAGLNAVLEEVRAQYATWKAAKD